MRSMGAQLVALFVGRVSLSRHRYSTTPPIRRCSMDEMTYLHTRDCFFLDLSDAFKTAD